MSIVLLLYVSPWPYTRSTPTLQPLWALIKAYPLVEQLNIMGGWLLARDYFRHISELGKNQT